MHTQYRDQNLGCGRGPVEAITWFFKNVEQGIILEDDSVPHLDFFNYCSELLDLYKNNDTIRVIGSANFQANKVFGDSSYYFSMQNGCFCSWATWKRTWIEFDYYLKGISIEKFKKSLRYYKVSLKEYIYWIDIFYQVKKDRFKDTCWDYQLMFSIWKSGGMGIVPNVNLATNIGFNNEATHTVNPDHQGADKPSEPIMPLKHPVKIEIERNADLYYHDFYYQAQKTAKERLILAIVIANKGIKSLFNINKSWLNFFKDSFIKARQSILKYKSDIKNTIFWNKQGKLLRRKILEQFSKMNPSEIHPEEKEVIDFLKRNEIKLLPYGFVNKYRIRDIAVFHDQEIGLDYVLYKNMKLYFRKDWSSRKIKKYYANLLAEQDDNSPHCYLTNGFNLNNESVVIDAGGAEGIFSLMVIEKAKKIFIFEPDPLWVEALQSTFEPWKEKVTIISKYVSSETTGTDQTSLDDFLNGEYVDFIKIDVEGWEIKVLKGAEALLKRRYPTKIVAATYHRQNDENEIKGILEELEFKVSFTRGYVPFYFQSEFAEPYLRRCLIRGEKLF